MQIQIYPDNLNAGPDFFQIILDANPGFIQIIVNAFEERFRMGTFLGAPIDPFDMRVKRDVYQVDERLHFALYM